MIAEQIEQWFRAEVCNSPASRDVESYNHLRAAVDRLKAQVDPPPDSAPAAQGEEEE